MKGFLVAGTASGVGKTTVILALLAAMRRRGLVVQALKGGPDFLDTGHHTRISGRVARNVDTWMLSREANVEVLMQAARGANAVLVEGMMGLFDGKSGDSEAGSSAEIAKLLKLPVVLVLDAGKSARSIAAVVLGFELFDPKLTLAGVILNRCASLRHFEMLRTAISLSCRTSVMGWLPKEPAIAIPERHLGLQTAEEAAGGEAVVEALALAAEDHLEMDRLMELSCGLKFDASLPSALKPGALPLRVGVARDRAFSFYYEDNLDLLREQGAVIVPFSPLDDQWLPEDLDALYLGGGYPELYSERLSDNVRMLAAVRDFASSGRPVYAECGGMIYLAQQVVTKDGQSHAMAGMLPFAIEMTDRLVQFGYVTVTLTRDCLLGTKGTMVRGHSFHYSRITGQPEMDTCYRVQYSLSGREEAEGYCTGNVLASYIHLHFRSDAWMAAAFVAAARRVKMQGMVTA